MVSRIREDNRTIDVTASWTDNMKTGFDYQLYILRR